MSDTKERLKRARAEAHAIYVRAGEEGFTPADYTRLNELSAEIGQLVLDEMLESRKK